MLEKLLYQEEEGMRLLYKIFKVNDINISSPVVIEQSVENLVPDDNEKHLLNNAIAKKLKMQNIELMKEAIEKTKKLQTVIKEKATKEAEMILDEARKTAIDIKKESMNRGYEDGFLKGYDEGLKKGNDEAQKLINEAKSIKDEIVREKERLYKECESDMVNIVLEVVDKIIGINLENNRDIILNLIKKGMENYTAFGKVTVRVCEKDYEHCVKNKDKLLKSIEFIDDINILKDLSLEKGDCIIETNSGIINSGVYTQLNALKKIFVGVLNE